MTYDIIINKICHVLKIDPSTSISLAGRPVITYSRLVQQLIAVTTVKEAANSLKLEETYLVQLIKKYLRPLATNKGTRTRWCTYLLGLLNLKLCSHCLQILELDDYLSRSIEEKASICIECNRIRNKKYTSSIKNTQAYLSRHRYKAAIRRARKIRATPSWANFSDIRKIYDSCPEGYHVDHIIPLKGRLVCGLHVSNNLQYLTAAENLYKGNRFEQY